MLRRLILATIIAVSMVLSSCVNIKSIVKHRLNRVESIQYIEGIRCITRDSFKRVLILYPYLVSYMQDIADNMCTIKELENPEDAAEFVMGSFMSIGELMKDNLSQEDGNIFVKSINKVTIQLPMNTDGTINTKTMDGFKAIVNGIYDAIEYMYPWEDYKGHIERGEKI